MTDSFEKAERHMRQIIIMMIVSLTLAGVNLGLLVAMLLET
jgi:hypothetical protein